MEGPKTKPPPDGITQGLLNVSAQQRQRLYIVPGDACAGTRFFVAASL